MVVTDFKRDQGSTMLHGFEQRKARGFGHFIKQCEGFALLGNLKAANGASTK